jgi:hypothetical protein
VGNARVDADADDGVCGGAGHGETVAPEVGRLAIPLSMRVQLNGGWNIFMVPSKTPNVYGFFP